MVEKFTMVYIFLVCPVTILLPPILYKSLLEKFYGIKIPTKKKSIIF